MKWQLLCVLALAGCSEKSPSPQPVEVQVQSPCVRPVSPGKADAVDADCDPGSERDAESRTDAGSDVGSDSGCKAGDDFGCEPEPPCPSGSLWGC